MRIVFDTHVHLYPFYDLELLLASAHRQLSGIAPAADLRVLCLTERTGQTSFEALAQGRMSAPGWTIGGTADPALLSARATDGRTLSLLAGRQLIAAERIEVLVLGADLRLDDGLPARDILARIREAGAVAVLPWGLGKWLGQRGNLISNLLESAQPGDFALADTYLLPALAPRPGPLRAASARGFRVLAGTDPLPKPGEEKLAGRYGVLAEAEVDPANHGPSLRRVLGDPSVRLQTVGRRGSLPELLRAF